MMSHGNVSIESGFSVDGDITLSNMLQETNVAQIIVNKNIPKTDSLQHAVMTQEAIKMARHLYTPFDNDRKRKEAFKLEKQKRIAAKRNASNDLRKPVADKKMAIEDTKEKKKDTISKCDGEMSALQN